MTPEDILAAYAAIIGDDAAAALQTAGLIPTSEETAQNVFSQNSTLTTTTVVWHTQHRYVTAWADVSS